MTSDSPPHDAKAKPSAAASHSQQAAATVSIIVPTYREAENLPELVSRISSAFADSAHSVEVLVVDDNSPDDTNAVCARLSESFPLRLLTRTNERGLATAVIHGMRHAEGSTFVVMDADLSHPPETIPDLLEALDDSTVDMAIGSRYVEGGSTEDDWGIGRRLNSKVATLLARPLSRVKDPMAGFFAIPRAVFERAHALDPVGYKIALEIIVKAKCTSIKEVPITFRDRARGESKLSLKEQLNYIRHLRRLYEFKLGRAARPLQFIMVGSTGMMVDLGVFSILGLIASLELSRAIAIWVAMSWNFLLNRMITFSYAREGSWIRQYTLFCLSCLLGALINWSLFVTLVHSTEFFSRWILLAAIMGILAGTTSNYLLSAIVVFRKKQAGTGEGG